MSEAKNSIAAALEAGAALGTPKDRNRYQDQVIVVPKNCDLFKIDADPSVTCTRTTDRIQDFIDYVLRFGTQNTLVAEDLPERAVAYLDYHEPQGDKPAVERPNDHTITLLRVFDKSFGAWREFVGRSRSQQEFVEFIDLHLDDIIKPAGAELLDLIENIEGRSEVRFNSVRRAAGGTRVTFSSSEESKAGEGYQATIPKEIFLRLPIFKHGVNHDLRIRVRVNVVNSEVVFGLAWLNLDEVLDHEEQSVRAALAGGLGGKCCVMRAK